MLFFKKKKKEEQVEKRVFIATVVFTDGRELDFRTFYPSYKDVAQVFAELMEYHDVIHAQRTTGEQMVFRTEDIREVIVNPEPMEE